MIVIEARALAERISAGEDADLCIIDLSSAERYFQGHVPGAVYLNFKELLLGEAPAPGKLARVDALESVFGRLGLKDNTTFVAYDDEGGGWAGRFLWTLDVLNIPGGLYLNGGIHAWEAEGLAQQTTPNKRVQTQPSLAVDRSQVPEIPEILSALQKGEVQIWDARSPAEYIGERHTAQKNGHIPGAINIEWTSLMDQTNALKIRKDARDYLAKFGIDGSKPIITHCQSHHRSGFTYLVGKTLGFDIRAYHGSWSEWGNHPDTPVER